LVQGTLVQFGTFVLQALRDGQHPSTGIGAGVPSGQILRFMVQVTKRHLSLDAV
jgi:hypothetical protein